MPTVGGVDETSVIVEWDNRAYNEKDDKGIARPHETRQDMRTILAS